MRNEPAILIVTEAHHAAVDAVLAAQGRGAGTFTNGRRLVASGTSGPVVARLAQDQSATDSLTAAWLSYAASGDLPDIDGVWGEDGVISAADAMAAHSGLTVHSYSGAAPGGDWTGSVLASHGYAFEPEPEI